MFRKILLCLTLLGQVKAFAQEKPLSPILMTMGPMDAESDQKSTVITVRYDSKPSFDKPKVEAMGSFLQITLPNTLVSQAGQFVDANSPYIRKFAAFQLDPENAGLRLFVSKDAALLAPALSVDVLENRVVILLDHIQAEKSLAVTPSNAGIVGSASSPEIKNEPEIKSPEASSIEPVSSPENNLSTAKKESSTQKNQSTDMSANDDDLQEKLVMVTIFLAFMLLLLLGLKTWRRLMARKWPLTPTEEITVKTLATHPLGPKQKLTVVQIGQEQILLGVSADQINFLSTLQKKSEPVNREAYEIPAMPKPTPSPNRRELIQEIEQQKALPRRTKAPSERANVGGSIAYGVGDDGIRNMKAQKQNPADQESIEDVTKLIRKKLRDLPRV